MAVGTQHEDFADFYRRSKDECLMTVLVSVGDLDTAQELVAEAFARAWASWRKVSRHPAPEAWVVRTALNVSISRWRRRRREVAMADPGGLAETAAAYGASPVDPGLMAALMRHPAPGQAPTKTGGGASAQLAAFTVTRQADGDVKVTIRQLSDAKGLAAALRADGVPAYVGFASPAPATCQGDPTPGIYHYQDNELIINPAAIPAGAGLFFVDVPATGSSYAGFHAIGGREVHVSVVRGSKYCPLS
jgi:DNA-directed RNA polymerase specialized sigma24 family protein